MSGQATLLSIGSVVIFLWGVGHILPTRSVVAGFGELSSDNTRIITMEWLIEGVTLCFVGARAAAAMLIVLAVISAYTGARTAVLPMKLCPYVKGAVALTFITATIL